MKHEHEWVVFSTAIGDHCLMVQCVECGAVGSVADPSMDEWGDAFHAPSRPYRWTEDARVGGRHEPPCPLYVVRAVTGALGCACPSPKRRGRKYERFPGEIVRPGDTLTEQDVAELEKMAEFVGKSDLCSRMFPLFLQSYQAVTGDNRSEAVKRIVARIEEIDRMGMHFSPQVVARVLRECIRASGR